MRIRIICLTVLAFVTGYTRAQVSNSITIQASEPSIVISKHIYGHFAEHLGRCIYDGFYVGEDNKQIPNINGVRKDVVDALKIMKIPNLRWPGGCFADTYHWKDGIGDKTKRPTIVNQWWGGVTEDNSFGTNDFLNMCELLGTEPYISGNVGSGTVQEFADWIQYANYKGQSPMSKLRTENGRPEPWNVKFWGVGNEAWGCGGNMKAEHYANLYRQFATYMGGASSSKIFRIASGASVSDYNWTEVMMRDIPHNLMEGVALHHYAVTDWDDKGSASDFTERQYFESMKVALRMEELVARHSTIMDKYDPAKKIALFVDEWGGWYDVEPGTNPGFLFQQNTMRDAMIAGATLNVFNNHADRVRGANLAQAINVLQSVILTKGNKMLLTPTYHVMEMYNVHQDAKLLPLTINAGEYVVNNEKLPAVSASASVNNSGAGHISIVNIDMHQSREISITIYGSKFKTVKGRILTSEKVTDHNTFEALTKIQPQEFKEARFDGGVLKVKVPPVSVVVLEVM